MKTVYKMPKDASTIFRRRVLKRLNRFANYTENHIATYNMIRDSLRYVVTILEDGVLMELQLCGDLANITVISVSMSAEEFQNIMGESSILKATKFTQLYINDPLIVAMLMEEFSHWSFIEYEL